MPETLDDVLALTFNGVLPDSDFRPRQGDQDRVRNQFLRDRLKNNKIPTQEEILAAGSPGKVAHVQEMTFATGLSMVAAVLKETGSSTSPSSPFLSLRDRGVYQLDEGVSNNALAQTLARNLNEDSRITRDCPAGPLEGYTRDGFYLTIDEHHTPHKTYEFTTRVPGDTGQLLIRYTAELTDDPTKVQRFTIEYVISNHYEPSVPDFKISVDLAESGTYEGRASFQLEDGSVLLYGPKGEVIGYKPVNEKGLWGSEPAIVDPDKVDSILGTLDTVSLGSGGAALVIAGLLEESPVTAHMDYAGTIGNIARHALNLDSLGAETYQVFSTLQPVSFVNKTQ